MSWRRRGGNPDANHGDIVDVVERMGGTAASTTGVGDGFPDLVVGFAGWNLLFEIKARGGSLRDSQVRFSQRWRGLYQVVRTGGEAQAALLACHKWRRAGVCPTCGGGGYAGNDAHAGEAGGAAEGH